MKIYYYYDISFLLFKANCSVSSSKYSKSVPIGIPCAILLIFTSVFSKIFFIYKEVVSPSIPGLNAKIISLIFSFFTLFIKLAMLIFSGFIPSIGEINPPKTWYFPLKICVLLKIKTFLKFSTTQIISFFS